MEIEVRAYAKINWNLNILGKYPDGYHKMDMLMQKVSLFDLIRFYDDNNISLEVLGSKEVPSDDGNIVIKTIKSLLPYVKEKKGIKVVLEKNIPCGAGLGGGSSDAAEVLKTLNTIWDIGLSQDKLYNIALNLGCDVPYFLTGGLCKISGKGEKIEKLEISKKYNLIIIQPCPGLSTKEVFSNFNIDNINVENFVSTQNVYESILSGDLISYSKLAKNDLQTVSQQLQPSISQAICDIKKAGAVHSIMSGSGSAVFGIFNDRASALNAYAKLKKTYTKTYLCYSLLT